MNAIDWIISKLLASSSVTTAISSWKQTSSLEYKMIFNGWVIPELTAVSYKIKSTDSATTTLLLNGKLSPTVQFRTVNIYRETAIDGFLPHKEADYSINCRAYTQADSEALAIAVFNAINKLGDASHNCLCQIEAVIPPRDEQDNFNCRVTARMKTGA